MAGRGAAIRCPFGGPAQPAAGGDFDGDGSDDVAVLANGASPRPVVPPGTNIGVFADGKTVPLADAAAEVAVGDLDGDDAVVAIPGRDRVVVRLGAGALGHRHRPGRQPPHGRASRHDPAGPRRAGR